MRPAYFLFAILVCSSFAAKCQTAWCAITFDYDENGYRISRQKTCYYTGPGTMAAKKPYTDSTKRMDSLADNSYQIYPNPVVNQANIRIDAGSLAGACSVTIMDAGGKVYRQQTITSTVTTVDLSGLPNATYFFVLRRGSRVNTVRLVKLDGYKE